MMVMCAEYYHLFFSHCHLTQRLSTFVSAGESIIYFLYTEYMLSDELFCPFSASLAMHKENLKIQRLDLPIGS